MNRSRIGILILIAVLAPDAFARQKSQNRRLARNDPASKQSMEVEKNQAKANPDSEKTKDRTAGVGAVVGYIYTSVGYGAETWLAPGKSDKFHLVGQFLTTKGDRTAESGDDPTIQLLEHIDYSIYEFALRGRFFVFNSFNISGGLSYDTISGNYGAESKATGEKAYSAFTSTAMLGHIGIGNHWSFDNGLLVGAEWVGYTFFLSNSIAFEKNEDGSYKTNTSLADTTSTDKKPEDRADEALRKSIEFKAATVTLGFQF